MIIGRTTPRGGSVIIPAPTARAAAAAPVPDVLVTRDADPPTHLRDLWVWVQRASWVATIVRALVDAASWLTFKAWRPAWRRHSNAV